MGVSIDNQLLVEQNEYSILIFVSPFLVFMETGMGRSFRWTWKREIRLELDKMWKDQVSEELRFVVASENVLI